VLPSYAIIRLSCSQNTSMAGLPSWEEGNHHTGSVKIPGDSYCAVNQAVFIHSHVYLVYTQKNNRLSSQLMLTYVSTKTSHPEERLR
jgi:hypothetical protein